MGSDDIQITPEQLERVLANVTSDAVLVGGQALAVWIAHYRLERFIDDRNWSVSRDVDFLGSRADVTAIARGVHGRPEFPPQRAITALVGQVKIPAGSGESANVDIIHRVVGLNADDVRKRAFEVTAGSRSVLVMHPLDVLASRVENLATLASKQNVDGIRQAKLARLVANAYIRELLDGGDEKAALRAIERVAEIAKSSAGRRVAREYIGSFKHAIPLDRVRNDAFRSVRLPRLLQELAGAAGEVTQAPSAASDNDPEP